MMDQKMGHNKMDKMGMACSPNGGCCCGCHCMHHLMVPLFILLLGLALLLQITGIISYLVMQYAVAILLMLIGLQKMFGRFCKCHRGC